MGSVALLCPVRLSTVDLSTSGCSWAAVISANPLPMPHREISAAAGPLKTAD